MKEKIKKDDDGYTTTDTTLTPEETKFKEVLSLCHSIVWGSVVIGVVWLIYLMVCGCI